MGYNFFVDSLGFNKAVSPDNPYQRATAPFRKDQIDTSATPGDNSLTGWWTRGQFSFHEGEGIKYYDVGESSTILNTCYQSLSVNTFTEVGEALLDWEAATWFTPTGTITDVDEAGGHIYCVENGTIKLVSNDTPGATATATSVGVLNAVLASDDNTKVFAAADRSTDGAVYEMDSGTLNPVEIYHSATPLRGIWYAKDRLWIADKNGNLYAEPPVPSGTLPVELSTPICTLDGVNPNDMAPLGFAASPGPVYLSVPGTSKIYRIDMDASGGVPTTASPVLAAELPAGDTVASLSYYLGYLVIQASFGVRLALVGDDGSLTVGPVLIDRGTSMATKSRPLSRGLQINVSGNVYEINLSNPNQQNPLTVPYRTVYELSGGSWCGIVRTGPTNTDYRTVVWSDSHAYTLNGPYLAASGTITTGYHRFDTLDSKVFHEVTVRGGNYGTIAVAQVDADGNETPMGSFDLSGDGEATFPFKNPNNLPDVGRLSAERAALKFTLSNVNQFPSPILYGYQIRALPAPKRQRMIRVPVFMFDVEQDSAGHRMGKAKGAWTRLAALEAYEEANSIVNYRDDDTGETGTAYIESIETQVESTSSARASDRGFGGIVTITLRRIGD
ncbi:MAG TPA: hypothetical protein VFH56_14375 [Acidimicrobiales bacterium]|nr:hypothetical protein [Acidimicrobiales bacterium]